MMIVNIYTISRLTKQMKVNRLHLLQTAIKIVITTDQIQDLHQVIAIVVLIKIQDLYQVTAVVVLNKIQRIHQAMGVVLSLLIRDSLI
ncbi:hypothetical protein HMPREF9080_01572 [Cardiobacterium valvarum F0432]|uniref:Uncharacterized protein n=1 Tax=Cardiobacterium valvarum F0432 TaxID=797473 RepID=G9ZFS0_9GAMM|nr:hypothetical protein HMPREF9080_01572 [Cardiobacterium valvarum F0432]